MSGMFGSGSLPRSVSSASEAEKQEFIAQAADVVRQLHCRDQAFAFSQCVEKNGMESNPERAASGPCRRQFEALQERASRVAPEEIIGGIFSIGEDSCKPQMGDFERCAKSKGEAACEREFVEAFSCASLEVVRKVQEHS
mmetsp:Transcript_3696/g.4306  ORF Transcript_3696/g.4306 Transcript_3696/m.4306 type:complete len:140 (+) Transcript_3696:2-421(+)